MSRAKEYLREDVLAAATQLFWEPGFSATSVSDLVHATGLNKHSMYKEFQNKEGLFLACLANYATEVLRESRDMLRRQPLCLANIEAFFQQRLDSFQSAAPSCCMLVNTAVEMDVLGESISQQTRAYLAALEESLLQCLQAAKERGEIPGSKDLDLVAKSLLCFLVGLNVVAKTAPPRERLEQLVKQTLACVTR